MIFRETKLLGVLEVDIEPTRDNRGFFARTWCQKEFSEQGLSGNLVQCSTSFNAIRGTLRGLHYQAPPFAESKLVRCTAGEIYDVAIDLREDSTTFLEWYGTVLSARNRRSLYIPEGCAHGFLTLADESEVLYQMSEFYHPKAACGVRWDDPAFRIDWPEKVVVISQRDRELPDFE